MIYEEIPELSGSDLQAWLESGDNEKVCQAIISASLYYDEVKATEICLNNLSNSDLWIARCSLVGLGHVARIHRNVNYDIDRVEEEIRRIGLDFTLQGEVDDLRRDIRIYILEHHELQ